MDRDKYIMIQLSMIPQEFVEIYNLAEKAHNGYIYASATKGIYGPPQAGQIAHDALLKQLEPHCYNPSNKNPKLWKHNSRPINFTFIVNGFGVKYSAE